MLSTETIETLHDADDSPKASTSQSNTSSDDPFTLGLLDSICLQSGNVTCHIEEI